MKDLNFDTIYKKHYNTVYNFIRFRINNIEDVQELTNDVFMKFYDSNFDPKISSPSTWLIKITKNLIIDFWRKKTLNSISIENLEKAIDEINGNSNDLLEKLIMKYNNEIYSSNNPLELLITKENVDNIHEKIKLLHDPYYLILKLHLIDQLSYKEIARITGRPLGTIKPQISRAKELLKRKIMVNI